VPQPDNISGKIIFAIQKHLRAFLDYFFTQGAAKERGICLRWLPAGAFARRENAFHDTTPSVKKCSENVRRHFLNTN